VPVLKHLKTTEQPGMALNVQENLKAFPVEVDVLTNSKVITKERFVDIRSKQHLLRCDFGESESLKALSSKQIDKINISDYDAVVISDYDKGFVSQEAVSQIMSLDFKETPVFVDTKKRDLSVFKNCIIKINEEEYGKLLNKGDSNDIIVTLGSRGVRWQQQEFPTKQVEVFDVSGAGDTFLASLVYAYLNTLSYERALIFANKCASMVVQKSGTYAIKAEDIEDYDICL
tara:strand:- start:1990 stop:2679 length:690 start_codon:yes stop_codon:yes gene_type:complete